MGPLRNGAYKESIFEISEKQNLPHREVCLVLFQISCQEFLKNMRSTQFYGSKTLETIIINNNDKIWLFNRENVIFKP